MFIKTNKPGIIAILLAILAGILFLRIQLSDGHYKNGQLLHVEGRILSEPKLQGTYYKISLGNIGLLVDQNDQPNYGDFIVAEGRYKDGSIINAKVIRHTKNNFFLFNIRSKIVDFYKQNLPEPQASLIAGITIGSKQGLSKDFNTQLRSTGTTHVVVASGMNVTLVAGSLFSMFLLFFKRKKAVALSLGGIWLYVALSGVEAPVVRAAVMASIAGFGQIKGRMRQTLTTLLISFYIMLMVFPWWIDDVGFWLSFGATAGLVLFETKVEGLIHFLPKIVRSSLATTIAANIGAAPIIIFQFGQFAPISLISNSLVLWTISPITILGGIAAGLGLIFPILGKALLVLIYPMLTWFVFVVEKLA